MAGPPGLLTVRLLSTFDEADTMSEVLRSLRVGSTIFCLALMDAPWGFRVQQREIASFHLVLEGEGVLEVDSGQTVALAAGDLVVLPHGDAHAVRDAPASDVTTISELAPETETSWEVRSGGNGARTELLCGGFVLENAHPLLTHLPTLIRVRGSGGHPVDWLDATVRLLRGEMPACEPGAEEVVTRVTDVLLAQAIRSYLLAESEEPVAALGDAEIGAAVRLMHAEPARAWTVTELAAQVALSRSAFSTRFRELTGESPMRYLTRFRLARAAEQLRVTDAPLGEIARGCGYSSEASFSRAFVRWFGTTPGSYRRRARAS
jgi:AraC-like DNA-binding protein/mannose-6-phosphate isomerase-like protein (cupin superfamily)